MMLKQEEIREGLAEKAHLVWQRWMVYMLAHLDQEHIERWKRQANTAYKDLPESEKTSDRSIADEYARYLHSQGVVIKVNRELPDVKVTIFQDGGETMGIVLPESLTKAGYVAVEPLTEEKE